MTREEHAEEWWTPKQTAQYLGLSPQTLARWRCEKHGPSFRKVGRLVRYDSRVVKEWSSSQFKQPAKSPAAPGPAPTVAIPSAPPVDTGKIQALEREIASLKQQLQRANEEKKALSDDVSSKVDNVRLGVQVGQRMYLVPLWGDHWTEEGILINGDPNPDFTIFEVHVRNEVFSLGVKFNRNNVKGFSQGWKFDP